MATEQSIGSIRDPNATVTESQGQILLQQIPATEDKSEGKEDIPIKVEVMTSPGKRKEQSQKKFR